MAQGVAGTWSVVGHCAVCELPMVSDAVWWGRYGYPRQRPEGHVRKGSKDLCHKHSMQARRAARATNAPRARARSAEEVLEDYAMIKDSCGSVAQAAKRMGMSWSALDQALYRARQRGDERAYPPVNQRMAS